MKIDPANVPDDVFLAYSDAESACWGRPDHGLRYGDCCRRAGLAAALPVHTRSVIGEITRLLGGRLGKLADPCPVHGEIHVAVLGCTGCLLHGALTQARRTVEDPTTYAGITGTRKRATP